MAAFVASVGSFGRSVAAGSSSCCTCSDLSMQTGAKAPANPIISSRIATTNSAPSLYKQLSSSTSRTSSVSRTLFGSISTSDVARDGRSGLLKIVARTGGSRPPPGARRPRPKPSRTQSTADNEDRDRLPVNNEITSDVVILIGEDGKMVGKMSVDEALFRARGMNLDLVQLDKQDPPCVKIVDYSKLKYELQKRKKEQQKKSLAKRMDLKELKMRYNIDTHDYGVRLKAIQKFLKDGDKVKLIVQFKGRELEFKDLGLKLFDRFQEDIGEEAIVESKQTKELRSISMVLGPNKGKVSGPVSSTEKSNTDKNDSGEVATVAAVGGEA